MKLDEWFLFAVLVVMAALAGAAVGDWFFPPEHPVCHPCEDVNDAAPVLPPAPIRMVPLVDEGPIPPNPCPRPAILETGTWDYCVTKTNPWKCLEQQAAWDAMLECARANPR